MANINKKMKIYYLLHGIINGYETVILLLYFNFLKTSYEGSHQTKFYFLKLFDNANMHIIVIL